MSDEIRKSLITLQQEIEKLVETKLQREKELKNLLEKLPIDENLLYFYGKSCPFTKKVEPEIDCLEIAMGKRIRRIEIFDNPTGKKLFSETDGPRSCGGVPFFLNKTTESTICGARNCSVLKEWALSQKSTSY